IAVNQAPLFAAELRKAGEVLSASGSGDETSTAAALAAVTIAIRRLGVEGGEEAVPIESLMASTPPPAVRPAPPPPPSTPADRARRSGAVPALQFGAESATDIAGTWMRYQQLVAGGVGPASLEELISGGRGNGGGNEAVDIRTLLYKGASAQHRAQELRDAAKRASGETLRAIIDEVCDLVDDRAESLAARAL